MWPNNPVLYEINTWVWLDDLSRRAGERITLATVPEAELDRLAGYGFDGIWLMGVWQRSPGGRQVALDHPGLQSEYRKALPDFTAQDVVGSPYAVFDYKVDDALGGDEGLAAFRQRLRERGILLMLDFVPNHLAIDHRWRIEHPERLLQGSSESLIRQPANYFETTENGEWRVFAHGRDPSFSGWTDTVQVDYRSPAARRAMADSLLAIAGRCDGVRCDMAMLVAQETFLRTWGGAFDPARAEFWPAVVTDLRARHPGFVTLAEVYWDLEWEMQQQGFDYAYDKRLYDRLEEGDALQVRWHLTADLSYQQHLARFIENHDERRAAEAFGVARSKAAAVVAMTLPGLRLLHEGQMEGWRVKLPVQLGRRPEEPADAALQEFYRTLLVELRHPVYHDGQWRLLEARMRDDAPDLHRGLAAHQWRLGDEFRVVVSNMMGQRAQGFVAVQLPLAGASWRLTEIFTGDAYERDGDDLAGRGLYVDLPPYGYQVFSFEGS
ncbi:MAG: alpha-amylase family glycosyl hydrolase [Caldilineales bacterium]